MCFHRAAGRGASCLCDSLQSCETQAHRGCPRHQWKLENQDALRAPRNRCILGNKGLSFNTCSSLYYICVAATSSPLFGSVPVLGIYFYDSLVCKFNTNLTPFPHDFSLSQMFASCHSTESPNNP